MKIAIIGDLHGKNCWKKLLKDKIDSFDKIIFSQLFTIFYSINDNVFILID